MLHNSMFANTLCNVGNDMLKVKFLCFLENLTVGMYEVGLS